MSITVEGEITVKNSYWVQWRRDVDGACHLEIDPRLIEALKDSGYELVKKQRIAQEK